MASLYVLAVSANSHGALILNAEGGLGLTVKPLDAMKGETRTPEFVAKNPFHCCPTYEEGSFVLWESNAILRHLAEKNKLTAWYPEDLEKRAKVNQLLDYRQTAYYPALSAYVYPALGFMPALDAAGTEAAKAKVLSTLEDFEKHYLAGGKFAGDFDTPTIADLALVPPLGFLGVYADFALPAGVKAYVDRFSAAVKSYAEVKAPLDGFLGYLASQKK